MDIKRGIIREFSSGTYKASVQLDGSAGNLTNVPVSRGIASAQVVAGRWCTVVFFDTGTAEDAMVVGVY